MFASKFANFMEINLSTENSKNKPVVKVKFSIGFGNNLFQYVFSRLLAEFHNANFCHPFLPGFNLEEKKYKMNKNFKTIYIKKKEYETGAYNKYFKKSNLKFNYDVIGYFEDYTIYGPHLDKIRNWFPKINKRNTKDLVIHLRLQNRLIEINHFLNLIEPKYFSSVIKKFNYEKLHIVTDLEKWENYSANDITKIKKDMIKGPNPGTAWVSTEDSLMYVNLLIKELSKYNPIVHCSNAPTIYGSGGLRGSFMNAFDFLRSFDQMILFNSTFSWWAAVLGGSTKVGVFSLWKPGRGQESPNLGDTNYKGWFNYGTANDLISNRLEFNKYKTLNWRQRYLRSTILKRIIQIFRFITFSRKYNSRKDYK